MIGIVIVSHSAELAEGVCKLAEQVAKGQVRLAAAGGAADPENPFGTDAFKVLQAIESVYSEDGVLVLMDLGSALLSADTALDLLAEDKRDRVRLCAAPLVEGAVAAATLAAAGAGMEEVFNEAQEALAAKAGQLGVVLERPAAPPATHGDQPLAERLVTLVNPLGLHARPAAQLVRLARRFQARPVIENTTRPAGPVEAGGISAVLGLGARQGHVLRLRARGPDAHMAVESLAAFIQLGCGEAAESPSAAPDEPLKTTLGRGQLAGIPASAGIAIGPLVRLRPPAFQAPTRFADDPEGEWDRLVAAIQEARDETSALYQWARKKAGETEAGIFDAQVLFLEDPDLIGMASNAVLVEWNYAEQAWQTATEAMAARLSALEDPYLRARAADVADVAARVMRKLAGLTTASLRLTEPSILAARDLAPSDVRDLDPARVVGLCTETGAASAHSVILARAVGIPAVVGLGPAISALPEGTMVAMDGVRGVVWVSPEPDQISLLESRRREWLAARRAAQEERNRPAATRDGRRIRVLANISGVSEAVEALECGAEGVGVLRTEFLFLGRMEAPDEEEQLAAYGAIAESLQGRPLVIRTLDVGGDKSLPYIEIGEEANPFLGWRGIRLTLGLPDLFRTQLRAILRAGAEHPVELLLPMVSSVDEVRTVKAILAEVEAGLEQEGFAFRKNVRVGVMIEVPSAVAVADQLAREAGFFSIGTNDLIQYAMAADRTNARVAAIADPFQPAVLRLIRQAIEAGREAGIEVALCGELAADPLATPLLLGLGLEELSLSAALIPDLKRAIGRWTLPEAESLARATLAQDTSTAVRQLLRGSAGAAQPRQ
jgi:phosphoenolpyruvate-protein phosphotransferase/dihydroxyacetone kinase phosphotransfer subunit